METRDIKVTTENGHSYELTETAVLMLMDAKNGRQADDAFEGFAPHVPHKDRSSIWFAVDDI